MSKTAVKHALNYHKSSGDWSLGFILNTHFKLLPVASCQEFADFSLLKTICLFVEKLVKCFFLKEVITPRDSGDLSLCRKQVSGVDVVLVAL